MEPFLTCDVNGDPLLRPREVRLEGGHMLKLFMGIGFLSTLGESKHSSRLEDDAEVVKPGTPDPKRKAGSSLLVVF